MDDYSGCPAAENGSRILPALILIAVDAVILLALNLGL